MPILTVAQLLGNLSRAGFGWREIRWRPALVFSAGAVPASVLGSRMFIALPPGLILRLIGVFLLIVVALAAHAAWRRKTPEWLLGPAGSVVGFVSARRRQCGPLGAAVFLGLHLPAAGVRGERGGDGGADASDQEHRLRPLRGVGGGDLLRGLALGGSLVLGSWTGRKLIDRLPEKGFALMVEALLVVSAVVLVVRKV